MALSKLAGRFKRKQRSCREERCDHCLFASSSFSEFVNSAAVLSLLLSAPPALLCLLCRNKLVLLPQITWRCFACPAAKSLIVQSQTAITRRSCFPTACVCVRHTSLVCLSLPVLFRQAVVIPPHPSSPPSPPPPLLSRV